MAIDLYSGILSEVGLAQGYHVYEGSQQGLHKQQVCVLLPLIINRWAEAGEAILPAQGMFFTLLDEAQSWDSETSVHRFREVICMIIATHLYGYRQKEGAARQEYMKMQEEAIRRNLQPGWRPVRYEIPEWEGGGWSAEPPEERYYRLNGLGWGSLGMDAFYEDEGDL